LRDDFKLVAALPDADLERPERAAAAARQKQCDAVREAQQHALRLRPRAACASRCSHCQLGGHERTARQGRADSSFARARRDEAGVGFLAPLGVEHLRRLEDRLSAVLFNEHRVPSRSWLTRAGCCPPRGAKMSELVFGPMLSARIAGLMAPERAIEWPRSSRRNSSPTSPSRWTRAAPSETAQSACRHRSSSTSRSCCLLRREYVTMGRFVDDLTDEAIRRVSDSIVRRRGAGPHRLLRRTPRARERAGRSARRRAPAAPGCRGGPRRGRRAETRASPMMSQLGPRQQSRFGRSRDRARTRGAECADRRARTASRHRRREFSDREHRRQRPRGLRENAGRHGRRHARRLGARDDRSAAVAGGAARARGVERGDQAGSSRGPRPPRQGRARGRSRRRSAPPAWKASLPF